MFDDEDKKVGKPDYYAGADGEMYRSQDYKKGFSPMWLLPILLIPLALLVWGGSKLLQDDNKSTTVARILSPTPAKVQSSGLTVGVGGGPDDPTSTPTVKPTATVAPKPTAKTTVGIGGGPDDPPIPSTPSTGHGW